MVKKLSRRDFVKTSAVVGTTASLLATGRVHAGEDNTIKIGLVGCGGRGRGAAMNALQADPNCKVVAIGDAFRENAMSALDAMKGAFEDRVAVKPENIYDGLECYKGVIPQCDVVLLCETPHFRHISLRAAVEAGKHIFCEKPVAVDGAGIKSVLESAKIAKEKKLNLVSGLCWRYDKNVCDIMNRILDGAIGEVCSIRDTYLTGKLWTRQKMEKDTIMMEQVRNWYNYAWLSGDFNVEQHVHSLDKAVWAMGDKPPVAAFGLGGRMARVEQPAYGDIYDSMAVVYEYPNGRTVNSFCRQQDKCWNDTDDYFIGTKGYANVLGGTPTIRDLDGKVIYEQKKVPSNMYVLEHEALFAAIRSGGNKYINNGEYMAYSTMLGIMGRLVCYTGQRLTWEQALNMKTPTVPTGYTWTDNPPTLPDDNGRYKVFIPGIGSVYHSVTR